MCISHFGGYLRYFLLQCQSDLDLLHKAIAIHTFFVVVWGSGTHPYFTAYVIVSFTWLFLIVFIAITAVPNTHGPNFYETPVGVSLLLYIMSHLIYSWFHSIGAGLATSTKLNNISVNLYGCG